MRRRKISIGVADWTRILEGKFQPATVGRYFPEDFLGVTAIRSPMHPNFSQALGCYWSVIGIADSSLEFHLPSNQKPDWKSVLRTALALNPNATSVGVYSEGSRILFSKESEGSWFGAKYPEVVHRNTPERVKSGPDLPHGLTIDKGPELL